MPQPEDLMREVAELRARLARLSEASLRINESLDLDTVLQGVLDAARALTHARYGIISTQDEQGGLAEFLMSGTTEVQHREFATLPEGMKIFHHFNQLRGPLRIDNFHTYATAAGLNPHLPVTVRAGMAAPIGPPDRSVGTIYLGHDREDQAFTAEDMETLQMFAAQAALAITNARRHREERRARADLETLIDISPVGVVVFDAATGHPKSLNREAVRLMDSLGGSGQTPEKLLEVLTFQRVDKPEVSFKEFPITQLLRMAKTIWAEEIVLRVPDGCTVTVLLNARPTFSDTGTVESFIVTLQDMAAVEEQERLRAEFLAMVSHELRAPLTSIKGSAATVLGATAELDPAVVRQFFRIIEDQADHMHDLVADLLDVARLETGTLTVFPEPAEPAVLVDRARSALGRAADRNPLEIDVGPDLPLVQADRRRIVQVLVNLLSNAARHAPPATAIRVSAVREGVHVAFSVTDQGRGIPAESLPHLFRKFKVVRSEEPGGDTGLGLAICKGIVEAHGGRIRADSEGPDLGARFTFTLPTVEAGDAETPVAERAPRQGPRAAAARVRVLAVDDDPQALRYIRDTLAGAGYQPVVTGDPQEVPRLMKEERPELVLLDLMLPDADGFELMQDILDTADVPVIFVSAYGQDDLVAQALDLGAVDYMVKPFSPTELTARIRAALRRREASEPQEPYVLGDLVIDYGERQVTLAGRPVALVAMEYRLLAELSAHGGRVLTYAHLLDRVWGKWGKGDLRPMRTMMGKLRRKLGDDAQNPTYIFTEPRVGYRMPAGTEPSRR